MMGISEMDIIKFRFNRIYQARPKALRSTFLYGPFGWFLRIIGWVHIVAGLSVIAACFINPQWFHSVYYQEDFFLTPFLLYMVIGFLLLLLGIAFLCISALCRKLVHRNLYILDIEELFSEHAS
ncbi:MAG: hypothetical protein JST26_20145 [Bacteroidetes bacterium]|nr:hypothetical protein [Bacteroidota bacterium]